LWGCPPVARGDSNISRAKTDVLALEKALESYKARNGSWPESLRVLAESDRHGNPAFIPERLLLDPWGRPYQFDPQQLRPEIGVPLIWSDGPDPSDPEDRITNWPQPVTWWKIVRDVGFLMLPALAALVALGLSLYPLRAGNTVANRGISLLVTEILIVLFDCFSLGTCAYAVLVPE
jgi:hypothetical protein